MVTHTIYVVHWEVDTEFVGVSATNGCDFQDWPCSNMYNWWLTKHIGLPLLTCHCKAPVLQGPILQSKHSTLYSTHKYVVVVAWWTHCKYIHDVVDGNIRKASGQRYLTKSQRSTDQTNARTNSGKDTTITRTQDTPTSFLYIKKFASGIHLSKLCATAF